MSETRSTTADVGEAGRRRMGGWSDAAGSAVGGAACIAFVVAFLLCLWLGLSTAIEFLSAVEPPT